MTPFDFNTASPEEVRAEAKRREDQRNGVTSYAPGELKRQASVLEKVVQQRVIKLYVRHGCKVYNNSQPRKAKYLTPGAADLQVFTPMMETWDGRARIMFYHETKRPKGGYSEDQLLFAALCRESKITVVGGGTEEAQLHLDRLNIKVKE